MIVRELRQERVILVCSESDCKKNGCKKLCQRFRDTLQEQGLKGEIRVQRTKCMGCCGKGPNVMAYPSATLYSGVKCRDVAQIIQQTMAAPVPALATG